MMVFPLESNMNRLSGNHNPQLLHVSRFKVLILLNLSGANITRASFYSHAIKAVCYESQTRGWSKTRQFGIFAFRIRKHH